MNRWTGRGVSGLMRILLILLAAILCIGCGQQHVQQQGRSDKPAVSANKSSEATAHDFMSALLRSLDKAQSGIQVVQGASRQTSLVDLMTANQNAAIAIRMAQAELRPYATSADRYRRNAVNSVIAAYEMIQNSLTIQLAGYERMDTAQSVQDLAGLRRQISNAKVAYQQGSVLLVEATVIAFGSMAVAAPGDTAHAALDMTASEKSDLEALADSLFGQALGRSKKELDSGPLAAARALRDGLHRPWRVAR